MPPRLSNNSKALVSEKNNYFLDTACKLMCLARSNIQQQDSLQPVTEDLISYLQV